MSTSFVDDDGTTRFRGEIEVSGGGLLTAIGPVTLTFADFAANWDNDNEEGGAPVAKLLAGDLAWGYRIVVTTQLKRGVATGTFVVLGFVDAGPGSWASPFATTPTNVEGDTGPSFIQANVAASTDQGALITSDNTLLLVCGLGDGPPLEGEVTVWTFVVRP